MKGHAKACALDAGSNTGLLQDGTDGFGGLVGVGCQFLNFGELFLFDFLQ